VIRGELEAVAGGDITAADVESVKSMIETDVVLSMESSYSRMSLLARQLLYFGHIRTLDQLLSKLESVTPEEVRQLANDLLGGGKFSVSAIGRLKNTAALEALVN
jgi:predicted Zn-dependent peptidase